jgi:hypothetical protein
VPSTKFIRDLPCRAFLAQLGAAVASQTQHAVLSRRDAHNLVPRVRSARFGKAESENGRRSSMPRSRVGQKLSDLTTSRVVMLVLLMMFIMPLLFLGTGIYNNYPALGPGEERPSPRPHQTDLSREPQSHPAGQRELTSAGVANAAGRVAF